MTTTETAVGATAGLAWLGIDVAKETFDAALYQPTDTGRERPMREIPVRHFDRTPEGVQQCIQWLDRLMQRAEDGDVGPAAGVRAVMEATGKYSMELAVWLLDERPSLGPAIINPHQAAAFTASLGLRNSTDQTACRSLARYGAERRPAPYDPPTGERAELRDLSRLRETLVEARVAEANRAAEGSCSKEVRRIQGRRLRSLDTDIRRVEEAMRKLLKKGPDLERDIAALQTIYGVGFITAVVVVAELGDLRRFERGRQLSAFAGLSPRNITSGTSVHKRPRMSKKGSVHVRKALYMPAMTAIRGDSDIAQMYKHMIDTNNRPMQAIGAVMRKLLLVMRAVLISGQPYQRHYTPCGKLDSKPLLST